MRVGLWTSAAILAQALVAGSAYPAAGSEGAVDVVVLLDTSESMKGLSKHALAAFASGMAGAGRLGLVTFGDEARLVKPLRPMADPAERAEMEKAIGDLTLAAAHKDIAPGLAMALDEIRLAGRRDARRAVVLVTDGEIAEPGTSLEASLAHLRNHVLYDFLVEGVPIHTVAFGDANLDVMAEIAGSTGGRCLVAPDAGTLVDALAVLMGWMAGGAKAPDATGAGARIGKSPEDAGGGAPAASGPPLYLTVVAIAASAVAAILGMIVLAVVIVNTIRLGGFLSSQPPPPRAGRDGDLPALSSMRREASRMTGLLLESRASLEGLKVDLEDFAAESWEKEKKLGQRYRSLASSMFLLLDHVELASRAGEAREEDERIARMVRQALEREGIEEIPVKAGDGFDGTYHRHSGDRPGEGPAGSVLEVARKGYFIRGAAGADEDLVLRHAEVIVSSGVPGRNAG